MAEADAYAGEHIQDNLEKKVQELGVDVRTGTKGLDLIMEDGKATGIKVECKEGTYDIKADAVIVATGGFSHNKELLAEYAPGAERLATSNQMGATTSCCRSTTFCGDVCLIESVREPRKCTCSSMAPGKR